MLAWEPDGSAYFHVGPGGVILRNGSEVVARPDGTPAGVVFADALCVVHRTGVVTDAFTGTVRCALRASGPLEDVRAVEGDRLVAVVRRGDLLEQSWFDLRGQLLERALGRGISTVLRPDGTLFHGRAPRRSAPGGLDRSHTHVTAAAVARAPRGPRYFLADAEGIVSAHGEAERPYWIGTQAPHRHDRLDLSGDGLFLYASGPHHVAMFDVATGAFLGEATFGTPGRLYPAPVGSDAMWLGADGPERVVLAGTALALTFRHPVRIDGGALVVEKDPLGALTALVRAWFAAPAPLDGFSAGGVRVARTDEDAPPHLREPWRIDLEGRTAWVEGPTLRLLVAEARSHEHERVRQDTAARARRDPALDAAILANPDDLEVHAVYADWLLQHGDPRGEVVALAVRQAAGDPDPALARREHELVERHLPGWLGPFIDDEDVDLQLGFVRRLSADLVTDEGWRLLHEHPPLGLVRALAVGLSPADAVAFVELVEARGYPPALRELAFGRSLPPLARFFATLPGSPIRHVYFGEEIPADVLVAHGAQLAQLERLEVEGLHDDDLAAVRAALPSTRVGP